MDLKCVAESVKLPDHSFCVTSRDSEDRHDFSITKGCVNDSAILLLDIRTINATEDVSSALLARALVAFIVAILQREVLRAVQEGNRSIIIVGERIHFYADFGSRFSRLNWLDCEVDQYVVSRYLVNKVEVAIIVIV